MARRSGRVNLITHKQILERLARMETAINELIKNGRTLDLQTLAVERDYWKNWAIRNGWAHGQP